MPPEPTYPPPSPGRRFRRAGLLALLAAPALVYLGVLWSLAINVPTGDDFFALFGFLHRWQDRAREGGTVLGLLFEQFYSHRIPFTRIAVLGLVALQGHCDLRLLLVVAWAGWLLLAGSLLATRRAAHPGFLWLLPVSLLLMQPQGSTNLLVATGSPGHAWTLLLAFWAFYFSRTPAIGRQGIALLLAAASALCTANGLLAFLVVAAGCLFRCEWRRGLAWLGLGTAAWAWYLHGYSVAEQPFVQHAFSPWAVIVNAAVMTGGVLDFGTLSLGAMTAAGLAILLAAGLTWLADRRDDSGQVDGAFLLFLLLSVAMTSYARVGWAADYMLQDRYRPYGLVLVAVLYLRHMAPLAPARRGWFTVLAVPAALVFSVASYGQQYSDLIFARRWAEATAMNLTVGRALPLPSAPEQAGPAAAMLLDAVRRGELHPPSLLEPADGAELRALVHSGVRVTTENWRCSRAPDVSGYLLEAAAGAAPEGTPDFGVLFQGDEPLVLPALYPRARFAAMAAGHGFLGPRGGFVLPASAYVPGTFTLYAVRRTPAGKIIALWSVVVPCP